MSTTLHIFESGSSMITNETNYVQYYGGRKYIITRQLNTHASGGSYFYRQTMIKNGRRYNTIPGSGMSRYLYSGTNAYEGHMRHVQKVRIYDGLKTREFVRPSF